MCVCLGQGNALSYGLHLPYSNIVELTSFDRVNCRTTMGGGEEVGAHFAFFKGILPYSYTFTSMSSSSFTYTYA